jgi:hypothetical protein
MRDYVMAARGETRDCAGTSPSKQNQAGAVLPVRHSANSGVLLSTCAAEAAKARTPGGRRCTHRKDSVRLLAPSGDGAEHGQHASNSRQRDAAGAVLQGLEKKGCTKEGSNTEVG